MNPKLPRNKCKNCGSECVALSNIYCDSKCHKAHMYSEFIRKWKQGLITGNDESRVIVLSVHVRRYIWEKYDNKCNRCGWCEPHPRDGKPPLEIEHIDGNSSNSVESNLILLCPNCHSLTDTYRGRNKGQGRANR